MTAHPILLTVARIFREQHLDAVLIGNAAAALQGAPVTTVDLDFLIRKTSANDRKLRAIAKRLEAVLFRPAYPVSGLIRLSRDRDTLQIDFMTAIHGIRSFEGLKNRAYQVDIGNGEAVLVASLEDIIASKRAAGRAEDKAVLGILEQTLHASQTQQKAVAARTTRRAAKGNRARH